jgi:hypothetical protein
LWHQIKGRARLQGSWRLLLSAALLVSVGQSSNAQVKPAAPDLEPEQVEVSATPIENFQSSRPDRRRFGRLEWRGGLVLTSPSPNFGGWSGLVISPGGDRLLAVSDAGAWLTAELTYSGGRPSGLTNARIGPLLGLGGKRLVRSQDRDAEAVALAAGTLSKGTLLVAFERNHRIGRFPVDDKGISGAANYLSLPQEALRQNRNQGLEAIAVLQGGPLKGAIVAFSERLLDPRGHHTGWIWTASGPAKVYLTERDGFDITDAAALPSGGLLVLERRFRWTEGVKFRLRLVPAQDIAPEAVLTGETLIEADMAYEIDNMEGVSVHQGPRGETLVTLISDDNFNRLLQRTLLLQFKLLGEAEAKLSSEGKPQ